MKVALSLLEKYVGIEVEAEVLVEAFVHLGFEVESMETLGFCGSGPLVVGQVLEKEKHPNSDHLSVCKVQVDPHGEPLQIVCGASNFNVGDRVPVALEGARLGTITIQKTSMRGFDSCGMMCSASELGLEATESHGLYILNDLNPVVGTPIEELFGNQKDVVFDLSITSNRGDCLSYVGIARELSAYFNTPVLFPNDTEGLPQAQNLMVSSESCDYYSGCVIEAIQITSSPAWMQEFLTKSGLHPINNVVDITNFLLLELGQPLHAFDADKLQGSITVRESFANESIKTLDNVDRNLPESTLIIADESGPIAIAGIMGGASSEICPTTRKIFLECAHFSNKSIRKTLRNLPIISDSAYRFERFVDKTQAPQVLKRAIHLLRETCPNLVVKSYFQQGSEKEQPRTIEVFFDKVLSLLGFNISAEDFRKTLERLNFSFEWIEENHWKVTVPSYRADVEQFPDLVEEFIRLYGTDAIPSKRPDGVACSIEDAPENELRNRHAAILSNAGFLECYTNSLQAKTWYEKVLLENSLKPLLIPNPVSEEHNCLRYSLIPGLIESLCENRHHGNPIERLFETGRIFKADAKGKLHELFATAFVVCPSQERHWLKTEPFNFYEGQNYVRSLITASGTAVSVQSAKTETSPLWQKGYCGKIGLWEQRGFEANLGYLDLNFTQHWFKNDIVFAAECVWLPERIRFKDDKSFQAYSECPVISKDLALWVPLEILGEEVRQALMKQLKKLVKNPVQVRDVRLFDVFKDEKNLAQKSLAFSLVFGSNTGTLTEEMVNPIFEALQDGIEKNYGYQVRKQVL